MLKLTFQLLIQRLLPTDKRFIKRFSSTISQSTQAEIEQLGQSR